MEVAASHREGFQRSAPPSDPVIGVDQLSFPVARVSSLSPSATRLFAKPTWALSSTHRSGCNREVLRTGQALRVLHGTSNQESLASIVDGHALGETAHVVSPDSICDAVRRLAADRDRLAAMGARARTLFENDWHFEKQAAPLFDWIENRTG